jgi:hypothetical protein
VRPAAEREGLFVSESYGVVAEPAAASIVETIGAARFCSETATTRCTSGGERFDAVDRQLGVVEVRRARGGEAAGTPSMPLARVQSKKCH